MPEHSPAPWLIKFVPALALGGLLALSYVVLRPFLIPVVWAGILAYVTWPLYRRLRQTLYSRATPAALLATGLLAAVFVLPALGLALQLQDELATAYQAISTRIKEGRVSMPEFVLQIPVVGDWLQQGLARLTRDPEAVWNDIGQWLEPFSHELVQILGNVGRNALKLGFALLTLFFLYRDGDALAAQTRLVLHKLLGTRGHAYLDTVAKTTKAVIYGMLLTALAQGALAGLGYWAAGLPAPVLLGVATAFTALIPFASPLVWGSAGIWLLLAGQLWAGVGLLAWGALVVSYVDNIIRPLVISSATRIPFLIVLFGGLGGIAAFGLIGLFVGPVILAVLMAVWREWLEEHTASGDELQRVDGGEAQAESHSRDGQ